MWSVLILAGLLITFVICANLANTDDDFWVALVGILSIIIFVGGFVTLIVFSSRVPTISVEDKQTINIVAISNGSELKGQFYLFGGYINEKQVYYYFKKIDNGGFVQESISAQNAVIFQDTTNTGYITVITNHKLVNPDYARKYKGWVIYQGEYFQPNPKIVEIHVPPNTILQDFKIDLANN